MKHTKHIIDICYTHINAVNLTVAYDRMGEARSYGLYREAHGMGDFGDELLLSRGEYEAYLSQIASEVELLLGLILEGRESVVFLAPMGAHNAIAVEAWQTVAQWDLHPGVADSVMNMDDKVSTSLDEPDCYPHPLDILAISALYQGVGE